MCGSLPAGHTPVLRPRRLPDCLATPSAPEGLHTNAKPTDMEPLAFTDQRFWELHSDTI